MKIIVPVVTAVVLALASTPASAASRHHKRHSEAATVVQPQIACTVVGCIPVRRGCQATRQTEHQPVLMWRCVRTTRFTASAANRTR
jgi:hypothetical protein